MTNNNQEMNKKKKHVAVFVFPFASHPGSVFNLVLKLANATPNTFFSFLGTEQSNKPLFSKPNIVIPNNLNFYTVADGIPKGHVLVGNNPLEKINFFLEAAPENLQKGLDLAVETKKEKVTCIIADAVVPASLAVAQKLNVPWVALWTGVPSSLSAHYYTDIIRQKYYYCAAADDNNAKEDITLDFIPGFSKMRFGDLPPEVINNINGGDQEETVLFSKTFDSLCKVIPKAKAVVFNFFEEIDLPLVVEDMRSKFESLLYVGFFSLTLPLPPLPQSESDETGCLSWLDKQKDRSVVYVCFGTVTTPAPHEIVGIAEALESSGFPFLWALNDYLKGLLPNGFVERTNSSGKIVTWAPQAHVLGHHSVGVYVTHSGTNCWVPELLKITTQLK